MKTKYANQKHINKIKLEECDKTHKYATINIDALEQASRELNLSELRLWLYISKNNKDYNNWDLSPQDVVNHFGGTVKNIKTAITGLIEKGYLSNIKNNEYDFNQIPIVEGQNDPRVESTLESNQHQCSGQIDPSSSGQNDPSKWGQIDPSNSTYNNTNNSTLDSIEVANAPDGLRPQAATLPLDEKNKEDINENTDSGTDITQGYSTDLVNFPKDYINKVLSSFIKKSGTGKVKINSIKKEFNLSETDARFCVDIGTALNKSNPSEYINTNKYCDKDRCLLYLDALNIEDNKGLIPKSDGSYSVYRVNDFIIDKDDLEFMYGMFIDPEDDFNFDKSFVKGWFKKDYNFTI